MSATVEATEVQAVNMTINGRDVVARKGQTILEAARDAGVNIPTLCHDPRLEPYGACRLCLVEVEGARGPMASCGTKVSEGMKVETHSEKILRLRKFILELLLTNHPLDCPVCEAAGDCRLQDYAYEYLVDMVPWGWRAPGPSDPGTHPNVAHFGSRCILCGRCVRICREVMSIGCWGYLNRGYDSEVDTPYRRPLQEVGCVSCGQCVSTCPVGAVTGQRAPMGAREWQTQKTRTVCSYCSNGCELVVHSYGGRVVRIASAAERGLNKANLCIKGRFGQGYADAPDRLLKPLVKDASGQLAETTWPEALARIADEVAKVKAEAAGDAFAVVAGTHVTNETAYLLQKFSRTVLGSNNVASGDEAHKAQVAKALGPMIGIPAATNSRADLADADVILVVGSNLTESNPVLALTVIKAIRQGKTVVVVDPRSTELARRASIHLAVQPGSDLAVLRGMMSQIVAQGLEDKGFITGRTEGYDTLVQSLKDVEVEMEAKTAGVDPVAVGAAAEAFAKADAAAILFGSGVSLASNAADVVTAIADLALLTGNIGKPGTGIYPLLPGANSQGLADMGVRPCGLPGGVAVDAPAALARFDTAWGSDLSRVAKGESLTGIFEAISTGKVRFVYVAGDDPALALADEVKTAEELGKLPFLVVQDSFLSETAKHADVVLPAAVSTEDEGTFTNVERVIQLVKPSAPAKGESLPDWKIVQAVANRLGADWAYSAPADVMREIADLVPDYAGAAYSRLGDAGLAWPCPGLDHPGTPVLFAEGFQGSFAPVASGVAACGADGSTWYALVSGSVLQHHETGVRSRRSEGLTKIRAAATVEMNPADAACAKVADGGLALVTSRAGACLELTVEVTSRVPAGVVFIPGFDAGAPVTRLLSRQPEDVATVKVQPL
jgi:predicted molibdopterin-dependent oxidoreductase YjgC